MLAYARKLIILLSIFALNFSNLNILAQCPGGSCPVPGYSSPYSQPHSGYDRSEDQVTVPKELADKIRAASVIVTCPSGGRGYNKGSGTLVKYEDIICVVTASHVVKDSRGPIVIKSPTISETECEIRIINTEADYAVLEPKSNQETLYNSAVTFYGPGVVSETEQLIISGYPELSTTPRLFGSRLIKYNIQRKNVEWMELRYPAKQGDSGGGVFTKDGKLAGIVWGSDFRSYTTATWIGPLTLEIKEKQTCFLWRFLQRLRPGKPDNPPPPSSPPPPQPAPPPSPPPPDIDNNPGTDNGNINTPPTQPDNNIPVPKETPSFAEVVKQLLYPSLLVLLGFISFVVTFLMVQTIYYYKSVA